MKNAKYTTEFLELAHKRSIFHFNEITESDICGCFYCKTTFDTSKILEWTDEADERGKTALCPNCGIDSVLSDKLPIKEKEFLSKMYNKYFS